MKYKDDTKRLNTYTNLTVKCKCGHSIFMPAYIDKIICTHCRNLVFRDKKKEFEYRLRKEIRK